MREGREPVSDLIQTLDKSVVTFHAVDVETQPARRFVAWPPSHQISNLIPPFSVTRWHSTTA